MSGWNEDFPGWEDNENDSFSQYDSELESDLYNSMQRSRAIDDLFGQSNGRGILGDMAADQQLAHDIASGMDVRDALNRQRNLDYLMGDRRSNGILSDMLTDEFIARDVENGMDIGEAISKEQYWANFWDDLFNGGK